MLERCRNHNIRYRIDVSHQALLKNEDNRAQIITFAVNGLFSLILDWHHGGYSQTIDQMADIVERVMLSPLCIAAMLKFGYDPHKVVMVGDAPGDCDAAEKNGVYYYPILVGYEKESWEEAIFVGFGKLRNGAYAEYEVQKKQEFLRNLGG